MRGAFRVTPYGLLLMLFLAVSGFPAAVTVNQTQSHQTIDGFGAFGAMNVWWSSGPFWNEPFLKLVFDTIGLTMIRTELYPIPDQTANWTKQIPYLRAVDAYVKANSIPFKFFASIWTPPASMKTNNNTTGGQLKTSEIANYGRYVVDFCNRFKTDVGAAAYGLDGRRIAARMEPVNAAGRGCVIYKNKTDCVVTVR